MLYQEHPSWMKNSSFLESPITRNDDTAITFDVHEGLGPREG